MKRIFPKNNLIRILTIVLMYGLFIHIIAIRAKQYYVIPLILGIGILLLNRCVRIKSNSFSITQGFTYFNVEYSAVEIIRYTKYTPFMSRSSIDVIEFKIRERKRRKFNYRMYSLKDVEELVDHVVKANTKVVIER